MNKEKVQKTKSKSVKKALFFVFIVLLLIFLSLFFRLVSLIKDSSFNSKDRFTISVINNESKAFIISFNPVDETISEVTINGPRDKLSLGRILGVPVDGSIVLNNKNIIYLDQAPKIINYALFHPGLKKLNLNHYDLIRLFIFSNFIPPGNYSKVTISVSDSELSRDKIAQRFITDNKIIEEQKSIEIVNATTIQGLGKRLERVIKNSGGNVIAVSNAQESTTSSKIIISGEDSYTKKRIEKLLGYPSIVINKPDVAEIKIVIGLDGIREGIF